MKPFFHIYGFLIGVGLILGVVAAEQLKRRFYRKKPFFWLNQIDIWRDFWPVLPGGLVGARLYHIVDFWSYYRLNWLEIFYVWQGGLGIFGGLLGGAITLLVIAKRKKMTSRQTLVILDLIAVGIPLGQAVGRWGNWFNQELYGLPSNLPWAIFIRPENRLPLYKNTGYFHPLFLYESLWSLLVFFVLLFVIKKTLVKNKYGLVFVLYLCLYSFGRFWLDFLRIRVWSVGWLSMAQWWSILLFLSGTGFIVRLLRKTT